MNNIIVIESARLRACFDPVNGALVELVDVQTGWRIHDRQELGLSFRLFVPLPDRNWNPVEGAGQKLTSSVVGKDAVTLTWAGLRSVNGTELDISFTGMIQVVGDSLVFTARVENRSPYTIDSVAWPCLGELCRPAGSSEFSQIGMFWGGLTRNRLFPQFYSAAGYFGTDYPIRMVNNSTIPFVIMEAEKQGLYAGYHDPTLQYLMQFTWELKPGFDQPDCMGGGMVPDCKEIDGQPLRMEFRCTHFPFIAPKETVELKPMVLQSYEGSWHKGADIYKAWRSGSVRKPRIPAWAAKVHSWQQVRVNSSEDDLRYSYKDLITIAEDCKRHGVDAIQVTGWNKGGQDRGNPTHDTDPKLGTWEDLKHAIDEAHKMGVRMVLFNKYVWADRSDPWFKRELIRYAAKDPYGDYYVYQGYMYDTPTQLADINTRRLVPMCHCCEDWRAIARREFQKSLDLGADGMLYDESCHHGQALYCFDPDHGHRVPAFIYSGDETLGMEFERMAVAQNPEFLMAGEANYEFMTQYYGMSYTRISRGHRPLQRYINPDFHFMAAVMGHNDRATINQCLMFKYIISYEPRHFKGRLDEIPRTMAYGRSVDALRRKYADRLWEVEYMDTLGASVSYDGRKTGDYAVLVGRGNGRRSIVATNFNLEKPVEAAISMENPPARLCVVTPECPEPAPFTGTVTIPPNSAVVIMEP